MERMRKPFQGVWTVVRFNWHFFVLSFGVVILLLAAADQLGRFSSVANVLAFLIGATTLVSLLVTFYVYDTSDLYSFNWLDHGSKTPITVVNIHAGFDETSAILQSRFPESELRVFDFYDPHKHTEISIKRARKVSTPFAGTESIQTTQIPMDNSAADLIVVFMSAHEIRNNQERIQFFQELNRIARSTAQVVVVEHVRNAMNFLAYTLGFFHFHSRKTWLNTFTEARFSLQSEKSLTPFVTIFTLSKNGVAS